jgi:hypothetical protein
MTQSYIGLGSLQDGNQAIYYNNALALATLINDTELMIQAYIGLGDARDGQDYGVTHYKMALTLLGEQGKQKLKARIHLSISIALSKFNITD